jgi:hypothetical protein
MSYMTYMSFIGSHRRSFAAFCILLSVTVSTVAQTNLSHFESLAKARLQQAEATYKKDTNNVEAAWRFARACFDFAEFKNKNAERAEIAQRGIVAAKLAVSRATNSAPAHYYLGMNIAQLARTKSLGALKLLGQMEHEWLITLSLDEKFDDAGADRNLGLLYRDAPSIGSIGSRPRARQHLEHAVKVTPDYPENRLNLIESYLKWGERPLAQRELKSLQESWSKARAIFADESTEPSWPDWEGRLKKVKEKLGDSSKVR